MGGEVTSSPPFSYPTCLSFQSTTLYSSLPAAPRPFPSRPCLWRVFPSPRSMRTEPTMAAAVATTRLCEAAIPGLAGVIRPG